MPGLGLQPVAIKIFAREMDDYFPAGGADEFTQGGGRELRIAARIIGDRNPINAIV